MTPAGGETSAGTTVAVRSASRPLAAAVAAEMNAGKRSGSRSSWSRADWRMVSKAVKAAPSIWGRSASGSGMRSPSRAGSGCFASGQADAGGDAVQVLVGETVAVVTELAGQGALA